VADGHPPADASLLEDQPVLRDGPSTLPEPSRHWRLELHELAEARISSGVVPDMPIERSVSARPLHEAGSNGAAKGIMMTSSGPVASAATPRTPIKKVVFASLIGTAVEWYDFFLYGSAAALIFGPLFFPSSEPATATLLAFGTYAVGFLARPLGGIIFGHFGDKLGRKKMLVISLLMMGVATFAIGLLPTYATIGVAAPLLLVTCRLLQGFAVGGEWGGAVLMAAEHGDDRRRGFWSSWPQAGVPAGNLLSAAVLWVLATVQSRSFSAPSWCWWGYGFG
jgi:Sugar (and other) transporter